MYLFAFVLLLVGILGIYTEVFAVQATRMYNSQTAYAEAMLTWHNAAANLALSNSTTLANAGIGAAGCSLTPETQNPCPNGIVVAQTNLPNGYNFYNMPWNSYVYQPNGTGSASPLYVITWAPPPAGNNQSLPITTPPISVSINDLYRQMTNDANLPLISYGQVMSVNGTTEVQTQGLTPAGLPAAYAVPSGQTVSLSSDAIVTAP
jgi:hypothetical protein